MSRVVYWDDEGKGKGYSGGEAIGVLTAIVVVPVALAFTAGAMVALKMTKSKEKVLDPKEAARKIVYG